jgi:hypothetical protein
VDFYVELKPAKQSPLSLLMARILTDHTHDSLSFYDLTFNTHLFNRWPHFHKLKTPIQTSREFYPANGGISEAN